MWTNIKEQRNSNVTYIKIMRRVVLQTVWPFHVF